MLFRKKVKQRPYASDIAALGYPPKSREGGKIVQKNWEENRVEVSFIHVIGIIIYALIFKPWINNL